MINEKDKYKWFIITVIRHIKGYSNIYNDIVLVFVIFVKYIWLYVMDVVVGYQINTLCIRNIIYKL